ncbi:MAG TPA: tetratricopeptide repeat-containing protein [Bryobacteraceae bacterium]|nr:tetratricopeptide repeat-containing protein [Bryobacteraceae bacterium]
MRAFIVRPFGTKQEIDFDAVHGKLIAPALEQADITGDTTAEILEAGSIRADMFELLLLADLVVADISIDNANVYYELGIRHALRARRTVMIRAAGMAMVPFDLRTDRYLEYDPKTPESSVELLRKALEQVKASERVDSPVFQLLHELREPDVVGLVPVPRDFAEEVARAVAIRSEGRLGLLGWEARGFSWEMQGLRIVGRSLFELRAFAAARHVWERVRRVYPLDAEANLTLATIFQRLKDLPASDQAIDRVLGNPLALRKHRAEAYSLRGRNEKTRLMKIAAGAQTMIERQQKALRSSSLMRSYENYRLGYLLALNHFYSGLNALAMVNVLLELIRQQPDIWAEAYDSEPDAAQARRKLEDDRDDLAAGVLLSFQSRREQLPEGERDSWLEMAVADHFFLTTDRPSRAAAAYARAISEQPDFRVDSVRRQLEMCGDVGIFIGRVEECLAVFPPLKPREQCPKRVIVFSGHMVDAPDRVKPRFPRGPEFASRAARAIQEQLASLIDGEPAAFVCIGGGASGGDLLFHEACANLGVSSRLRLTLPAGRFMAHSVTHAGPDWEARFRDVSRRLKSVTDILSDEDELPGWLMRKPDYNIWARTNIWMLEEALAMGADEVHLLALWNGESGGGAGGTDQMVEFAREQSVPVRIIDSKALFGL